MAESPLSPDGEPSKQELVAAAKKAFDLILRVRMHGPLKMEKAVCEHLEVPVGSLHLETLERIGRACKTGDTSRGSTYSDRGLLYGSDLYRSESGHYVAGYRFLCKG